MFGRSKKKANESKSQSASSGVGKKSAPSVISADMNVLGSIISDGFIDIDGNVDGNVKCDSAVIRTNGSVKGDVIANDVQIYGYVEGLVKAETVSLYHTAQVTGVIMHESLTIEDGAFVDGKFKRMERNAPDEVIEVTREELEKEDENRDEPAESVMDNLKLISG